MPAEGPADFRAFAGRQGVVIPTDADTDVTVQRVLATSVAQAKWGDAGSYGVAAKPDPEVDAAVKSFERAASLLGATR